MRVHHKDPFCQTHYDSLQLFFDKSSLLGLIFVPYFGLLVQVFLAKPGMRREHMEPYGVAAEDQIRREEEAGPYVGGSVPMGAADLTVLGSMATRSIHYIVPETPL
jgi:hypothetical protein